MFSRICRNRKTEFAAIDRHLESQRGTALVLVLIVTSSITLLASYSLSLIYNLGALSANHRLELGRRSLSAVIELLYRDQDKCTRNLLSDPAVKDSIQKVLLGNRDIETSLMYPTAAGGPSSTLFIGLGSRFGTLEVTDAILSEAQLLSGSTQGYLLTFKIALKDTLKDRNIRPLILPIYVTTTSTGTVESCSASRFSDSGLSLEDQICVTTKGPASRWNPFTKTCSIGA